MFFKYYKSSKASQKGFIRGHSLYGILSQYFKKSVKLLSVLKKGYILLSKLIYFWTSFQQNISFVLNFILQNVPGPAEHKQEILNIHFETSYLTQHHTSLHNFHMVINGRALNTKKKVYLTMSSLISTCYKIYRPHNL